MFYEVFGILVVAFCGIVLVANAIDAFRSRHPPTFK
jgi:hypothetical protein